MKKINRNELRQQQREANKLKKWYISLSDDKKRFIGYYIEQKTIENDNIVAAIMDKCYLSALDDNLNIDLLEMKKIVSESNGYLADYKEYLEKNGNGGFDMIENEELRNKVKARIKEIMAENKDKAKGLNRLKKEFNLPQAELSDMWAECKIGCVTNPHTPKKFVEPQKEVKKVEKVAEIPKVEKVEKEIAIPKKSQLKVVNTILEIQGTNGCTYIKSSTGVKLGNKLYSDKSIVEDEEKAIEGRIGAKKDDIRKQIEKLSKELGDLMISEKQELEKYEELKMVFDL